MLAEHFIASIGVPAKAPGPNVAKDAAIFLHEFQPLAAQRTIFKKSATPPNCLAISESHIFAAQADKGVVHVYNRLKGTQEAIVPFTEKLASITLTCDDSVLVLGTAEGRIFLWETCTGRQITTTQAHLQAVTALAVDATSNFLLSASKDSTVHVWSLPALLSFSTTTAVSPLRTFSSHRSEITSLVLGSGATHCNFAVSTSRDKSCLVWDYRNNHLLRTYLLPGVPLCLALDPADRAAFVGYEDGTLQQLDLHISTDGALDAVQNAANPTEPVQPPASSRWKLPEFTHGSALSLSISFDGSMAVSGHQSGTVLAWDVPRGSFVSAQTQLPLPGPVNNVRFLQVTGFAARNHKRTKINEIVKPKFGAFDSSDRDSVPGNYTFQVQFPSDITSASATKSNNSFLDALTAPSFPSTLLDDGLNELAAWKKTPGAQSNVEPDVVNDDFMAFDESTSTASKPALADENASLKLQLEALRRVQQKSMQKIVALSDENSALQKQHHQTNGASDGTSEEEESSSEDDSD